MERDLLSLARRRRQGALWLLGFTCLALRLPLLTWAAGAPYDMQSYALVAKAHLLPGLYSDPSLDGRYPYLPLWALVLKSLDALADLTGWSSAILFRLPALFADLGLTALLYSMVERLSLTRLAGAADPGPVWASRAFWTGMAWAANPLAALVSAGHGQFDSVALFFIVAATWAHEFGETRRADLGSALALGVAIALKSWPLAFLPLFLGTLSSPRERWRWTWTCLAGPLLLALPWLMTEGPWNMLQSLRYHGSRALSLPEALRSFFFATGAPEATYRLIAGAWETVAVAALGGLWTLTLLGVWSLPLLPGLALVALTMLVLAPAMATQYLVWAACLGLLLPGKAGGRLTLVGLVIVLPFYRVFFPEVLVPAGFWSPLALPQASYLVWALLNLGLWFYLLREWSWTLELCRRPRGRLDFA